MQNKIGRSLNALKHGITSNKMFLLQNENPAAWAEMLDICTEQFRPTTRYERTIVEEIAFAKWRLRRLWIVENGLMDVEMDDQAPAFAAKYASADEGVRQTLAFKALTENSNAPALLNRYQVRLERSIERAVRSLNDLRAAAKISPQPAPEQAPEMTEAKNTKRTSPPVEAPVEEKVTLAILQNELRATPVAPALSPDATCSETAHRT